MAGGSGSTEVGTSCRPVAQRPHPDRCSINPMWQALALTAVMAYALALGLIVHHGTRNPTPHPDNNQGGDDAGGRQ